MVNQAKRCNLTDFSKEFFREVTFEHKTTLEDSIPSSPLLSCEYCFTNLFSWRNVCGTRWGLFDGGLTALFADEDEILMPAGTEPAPHKLYDFYLGIFPDCQGDIAHVPAEYIKKFPSILDFFEAEESRDQSEYLHKTENLVHLKGQAFHKKKNLLNQFLRNNPTYSARKITSEDISHCFELSKKWCEDKTCETFGISHEQSAIKETLSHFDLLGVEGVGIFINEKLVAFSVFTIYNDACIVHYEKYDRAIKGCAQAINWETAKSVAGRCEYINREQDLGIEGLRKAKTSYNPDILKTDFVLTGKKK